ncbi:S1 family peptidase [Streptomyces sp. NPDC002851]
MRPHTAGKRRTALAAAAIAALVTGSLSMVNANAAEPTHTPKSLTSAEAADLAGTLTEELRGDAAGAYYDAKSDKLVVNVTDRSAAAEVRRAGAEAKVVEHSTSELTAAKDALTETAVPGTARAVDPVTNQVVVTADNTVKGAALKELKRDIAAQDGKAVLRHTAGAFKPLLSGGDAIYTSGGRCSLGFNVTVNGAPHFLTAGHCPALAGSSWSDTQGGQTVGETVDYTFPGADMALVKYVADVPHPSEVNLYNGSTQEITGAREAVVGEQVQRSGSTTQLHDGSVQALDVSVSYPQGTVNGLIQTDVCAEPGDSGGAMFAGGDALGLTSGGSGNCSSGGQTFFQPVPDALSAYGATLP